MVCYLKRDSNEITFSLQAKNLQYQWQQTKQSQKPCELRNKISNILQKMDPSELRMNLASLQRIDPYIAHILMASSQVRNALFLLLSKVSSKISIWLLSYCEILILTISQWKVYAYHQSKLWGIERDNFLSSAQMKEYVYVKFRY